MKIPASLRSTLKTVGAFAGGNFLAAAISGVSGILYSRWISPDDLGEFNKYGILTGYLGIGLIFVHGALQRQYPYLIGKGETEEATRVSEAAKWWYMAFSWIGTLLFAGLTVQALYHENYKAVLGWLVQIPALWMAIYGLYLQAMYRNSSDFVKLSNNQLIASVVAFVLLVLVKFFSYWGFLVRFFIQGSVSLWVHEKYNPSPVKARFDFPRLKQLAKMSLPLSVPAYIDTYLLNSSISFFILNYLGERNLGIYSWALMLQGMAMILVRAIHQIYVTRITIRYGQTNDIRDCFRYSLKPTLLSVATSVLMALAFHFAIEPFVALVAPNYLNSVPVLRILIWQMPLFASGLGLIIMSTALWYKSLITLRILKTIFCLLIIWFLPRTINGVAWGIVFSDLLYYLLGYVVLIILINQQPKTDTSNHT